MGLGATIKNRITRRLFSPERRDALRRKAEKKRMAEGERHVVEYFHEAGDPYSHLMVQLLPDFLRRYEVDLVIHLVAPPPDWAAPDRDRLESYSLVDAARLAARANLQFTDQGAQPPKDQLQAANAELMDANARGDFLSTALDVGSKLWSGQMAASESKTKTEIETALEAGSERRDALGHYLGGTLYYAGEWYWGPDRLHHLEHRLRTLGVANTPEVTDLLYPPAHAPSAKTKSSPADNLVLHWYLSFRSPYTGIVADRVKAMAEAYGAELELRYVLPMVMRGMKVPRKKGFYIMSDVVREAERQGIPFGNSVDPVGKPVERGYAILEAAIERGQGFAFAQSFLSGVWADGIDAGSDRGLKEITERAGLSWSDMKAFIGTDDWRAVAEANRQEMFKYDIWGVPSFRVGDVAAWGQDRLWVIEDALQSKLNHREA